LNANRKWEIIIILCATLVISVGCNFLTKLRKQQGLTTGELRQTLAALSTATRKGTRESLQLPIQTYPSNSQPTEVPEKPTIIHVNNIEDDDTYLYRYYTQPGDWLHAIYGRFGVEPGQITSHQPIDERSLLPHGQLLEIPNLIEEPTPFSQQIIPDSALINSPSATDFYLEDYIQQAGGYLSKYAEQVDGERLTGIQIVERVSLESSVNPMFLLALLEYQSGWVFGEAIDARRSKFPIGFEDTGWDGLYKELVITATHLNMAYYGWRAGQITHLKYRDGQKSRMHPELNVGSATVQHLMAKIIQPEDWEQAIYGPESFLDLYIQMFGDPWKRESEFGPILPYDTVQPELELPYLPGERWSLTGGPHESWKTGSPRGALDLAPVTGERACLVSRAWVTASASGLVVRSDRNVVAIDLDKDGFEQTGWVIIYFHVADKERIKTGVIVDVDERIGHPSCEGGNSTGTHVHIARKFNGEWIAVEGPLPLILSCWVAHAYDNNYLGELRKGEQVAVASPVGPQTSIVIR